MGNESSKSPEFLSKEYIVKNCDKDWNSKKCKAFRANMVYTLIISIIIALMILMFLYNTIDIKFITTSASGIWNSMRGKTTAPVVPTVP